MMPPQSSTNCAQALSQPVDNELITEGAVSDAFTREHRDRLRY